MQGTPTHELQQLGGWKFAARFGFSVATLRHWERGDRSPQGASLVLLNVIKRAPDAVQAALN